MVVRMKTSLMTRRELALLVNCAVKWEIPRVNSKREQIIICGSRMYLQCCNVLPRLQCRDILPDKQDILKAVSCAGVGPVEGSQDYQDFTAGVNVQ